MNLTKNTILAGLFFIISILIFVILFTLLKVLRNRANRNNIFVQNKGVSIDVNKNNDRNRGTSNIANSNKYTKAPYNELKNMPEYISLRIGAKFSRIHNSLLDRLMEMIADVSTFEGNAEDLQYDELRKIISPGIIQDNNIAKEYFLTIKELTYKYGRIELLYFVKVNEHNGHITKFLMKISMFSPLKSVVKMRFIPYLAIIYENKELLIALICNDVGIACGFVIRDRIFEKVDQ